MTGSIPPFLIPTQWCSITTPHHYVSNRQWGLAFWSLMATNTASAAPPSEEPCGLFPVAATSALLWSWTSMFEFSGGRGVVGGAECGSSLATPTPVQSM